LKAFTRGRWIDPFGGALLQWVLRTNFPTLTSIVLVLLWSACASYFTWRWELKSAEQEFRATAESRAMTLQNGVDEYLDKLEALAALFESSEQEISRRTFERFANMLVHVEAPIQAMSWVPRVLQSDREAVEAAAVRDGIPDFRIKTVSDDDGSIAPSLVREEYFPILYSTEPPKSPIYGIDLASGPQGRGTIDRARDSGMIAASPVFLLHRGRGDLHGFFVVRPVYLPDRPHATIAERRRNLAGFVEAVFQVSVMLDEIMAPLATVRGVDLSLFDRDARPNDPPVYQRLPPGEAGRARPTLATATLPPHWSTELQIGDAHMKLVAAPRLDGPFVPEHHLALLVLLTSMFVGLLLILYMRSSVHHAQRLVRAHDEISKLALRDPLTGLFNRRAFVDKLATAFRAGHRRRGSFAVLYFDLDHFKDVNDTLGHPIGDQLLQQVARRVQGVVRAGDTVARFGGDEFAILVPDTDGRELAGIAGRINQTLAAPFTINGNDVHVSASIGIAQHASRVATPETLMIQADLALYRAKHDGRNCFRFHSAELDIEIRERVTTADELRNAAGNGELQLYYQPQVELASGRIIGVEALLRWHHPTRGLLLPSQFIPLAERAGIIADLGEWVLDAACRQMRRWCDLGVAPELATINVSACQFKSGSHLERSLCNTLSDLPPFAIELDLTESVLMEVTKEHTADLERLRALGVSIAIDDFGTGYSSLSYLTSYPISRLKIAQQLVSGVNQDRRKAGVVRASIRLAQELDIACIAEGIEDAGQVEFLMAAGCLYGQGFYFGRPGSAEEMTIRLQDDRRKRGLDAPPGAAGPCLSAQAVCQSRNRGAPEAAQWPGCGSTMRGDDPMAELAVGA
jgi:diguanylate cyclase (GGDEF)-like protein